MKTWSVIVVGAIFAVWLWIGNLQQGRWLQRTFPTPRESWQASMEAEAAAAQSPKVELPLDDVEVFPRLIVSFTMKAGQPYDRASLIIKKGQWMREHPGWRYTCEWQEPFGLTAEFLPPP